MSCNCIKRVEQDIIEMVESSKQSEGPVSPFSLQNQAFIFTKNPSNRVTLELEGFITQKFKSGKTRLKKISHQLMLKNCPFCGIPYDETKDLSALDMIAIERRDCIEKRGYDILHDAQWTNGQLAMAAACYTLPHPERYNKELDIKPYWWPFDPEYWKPDSEDRIKELVKAGQFVAAEISRLQGLQAKAEETAPTTNE